VGKERTVKDRERVRLFDHWAPHYDGVVETEDEPFPFAGYSRVLQVVVEKATARPSMHVLNLGTGTGLDSRNRDPGLARGGIQRCPYPGFPFWRPVWS